MPSHGNAEANFNHISGVILVIDETYKVNVKCKENENQCQAESELKKNHQRSHQFDPETLRVTLLMVVVTVVYIVSFLPCLVLPLWHLIVGWHRPLVLSEAGLVAYHIGLRSYLLNSALNPWIYGIFNSQFRRFFFGWSVRKRGSINLHNYTFWYYVFG